MIKKNSIILALVLFTFGFIIGNIGGRYLSKTAQFNNDSSDFNIREWTCSMHPQIKLKKKGLCPICGMDLIPIKKREQMQFHKKNETVSNDVQKNKQTLLTLSEDAEKLASIQVTPVIRSLPKETLVLHGVLTLDQSRIKTISAWFPGRVEKLFIDYVGINVKQRDHMAIIYGPELIVTQKELLNAKLSGRTNLVQSTRKKLHLLGLSHTDIENIEKTKRISENLTINAPIGGVILKKFVSEGDYIQTGSKIYQIANLSRLWLVIDVYEMDIKKIHYGQEIIFKTKSMPHRVFKGTISFIEPIVDPSTGALKVRAIIDNKNAELKPGMLAQVNLNVTMDQEGSIPPKNIKNMWIGPMHPEEIFKKPGKCSICGMKLKKASQLGLISERKVIKPLVIPASAPLITGKRAITYVKKGNGIYEGVEVILGSRVGDYYIVKSGLKEGDLVVTKGSFKIDASMQIQGKPSMMQYNGSMPKTMKGHLHE